jgi:hypothetical protein
MHEGELQKRGYNTKTKEDPPVALNVLHAGANGATVWLNGMQKPHRPRTAVGASSVM